MEKKGYVYILTNKNKTVLYIGVTSDLIQRIWQHKQKTVNGFSKKYNLDILLYYEIFDDIATATLREMQLKEWKRSWKEELIAKMNPHWCDLYEDILK